MGLRGTNNLLLYIDQGQIYCLQAYIFFRLEGTDVTRDIQVEIVFSISSIDTQRE